MSGLRCGGDGAALLCSAILGDRMGTWPPPRPLHAATEISRVPYLPGLDGMRALAVVAVMIYHANQTWLSGGFLGVEVFFVISGYLITLLLISEHERKQRVSLKQFWLRRARRLLPALFLLLGGLAIYMALFYRRPQGETRGDFLGGLLYGSNWYQIFVGQSYTAGEAFAPLRHLWSLAVEEQFYLLWPLIMVVILRGGHKRLPKVGVWLAGVSVAITVAMSVVFAGGDIATTCSASSMHGYWSVAGRCLNVNEALYLGTFSRAGGLLMGSAFAMLWRPVAILRGPLRNKQHRLDLVALVGLVGLGVLMWRLQLSTNGVNFGVRYDPWLFRGGFLLTGIATVMVIAGVTHRRAWAGKVLGNPVLNWIGTRSYGLYLYHWPVYEVIRKQAGVSLTATQFTLAMAVTVIISEASYRLVETPIRHGRLSQWLRGERRAQTRAVYNKRRWVVLLSGVAAALVGFAGVSIATATNQCVGPVACSVVNASAAAAGGSHSGRDAGSSSAVPGVTTSTSPTGPGATVASDPTSTVDGTTPTGASTTDSPATGIGEPEVTAVPAESTVAPSTSAPGAVEPPNPAAPGPPPVAVGESVMLGAAPQLIAGGFVVNADVSRQGLELAAVLEQMRVAGQLGQTVVVQAGTNGSVSDATYDRIMATVPASLTANVYFLTVRAPRGWIDGNNARIMSLPARYPNVHIIDWAGQSVASNVPLCKDGIHVVCGGGAAQFYANMIFDGIGRPDLKK
ncbi:MAG: acyltransferase family protein [Ilumatobacteraceae bacterium]